MPHWTLTAWAAGNRPTKTYRYTTRTEMRFARAEFDKDSVSTTIGIEVTE